MDLDKRVIVYVKEGTLRVVNRLKMLYVGNSNYGKTEFSIRMTPKNNVDIHYNGGSSDGLLTGAFSTHEIYIKGQVTSRRNINVECCRSSIDHNLGGMLSSSNPSLDSLKPDLKQILESLKEGIKREKLVFTDQEQKALNKCFKVLRALSWSP